MTVGSGQITYDAFQRIDSAKAYASLRAELLNCLGVAIGHLALFGQFNGPAGQVHRVPRQREVPRREYQRRSGKRPAPSVSNCVRTASRADCKCTGRLDPVIDATSCAANTASVSGQRTAQTTTSARTVTGPNHQLARSHAADSTSRINGTAWTPGRVAEDSSLATQLDGNASAQVQVWRPVAARGRRPPLQRASRPPG